MNKTWRRSLAVLLAGLVVVQTAPSSFAQQPVLRPLPSFSSQALVLPLLFPLMILASAHSKVLFNQSGGSLLHPGSGLTGSRRDPKLPLMMAEGSPVAEPDKEASRSDSLVDRQIAHVLTFPAFASYKDVDWNDPAIRIAFQIGESVDKSGSLPLYNMTYQDKAVKAALDQVGITLIHLPWSFPAEAFETHFQAMLDDPRVVLVTSTKPHKETLGTKLTNRGDLLRSESAVGAYIRRGVVDNLEIFGMHCDGQAFVEQYQQLSRIGSSHSLVNKHVVVLGAKGGAGKAVVIALMKKAVGHLTLTVRSPDQIAEVRQVFEDALDELRSRGYQTLPTLQIIAASDPLDPASDNPELVAAIAKADVLINATGKMDPLHASGAQAIRPGMEVFELAYRTPDGEPLPTTPLLDAARSRGAYVYNGLTLNAFDIPIVVTWFIHHLTGILVDADALFGPIYAAATKRMVEATPLAQPDPFDEQLLSQA